MIQTLKVELVNLENNFLKRVIKCQNILLGPDVKLQVILVTTFQVVT